MRAAMRSDRSCIVSLLSPLQHSTLVTSATHGCFNLQPPEPYSRRIEAPLARLRTCSSLRTPWLIPVRDGSWGGAIYLDDQMRASGWTNRVLRTAYLRINSSSSPSRVCSDTRRSPKCGLIAVGARTESPSAGAPEPSTAAHGTPLQLTSIV